MAVAEYHHEVEMNHMTMAASDDLRKASLRRRGEARRLETRRRGLSVRSYNVLVNLGCPIDEHGLLDAAWVASRMYEVLHAHCCGEKTFTEISSWITANGQTWTFEDKTPKCSFCSRPYSGLGYTVDPLPGDRSDRCCKHCFKSMVLPARIEARRPVIC
jgi:hypothetical protein